MEIYSYGHHLQPAINWGNGLAPDMRQATTWNIEELVHCRIYEWDAFKNRLRFISLIEIHCTNI